MESQWYHAPLIHRLRGKTSLAECHASFVPILGVRCLEAPFPVSAGKGEVKCPFGAGFMARLKIQFEVSSRNLLEQIEGREFVAITRSRDATCSSEHLW